MTRAQTEALGQAVGSLVNNVCGEDRRQILMVAWPEPSGLFFCTILRSLYVTASTSVYRLPLAAPGTAQCG
jgi:hypothetical protein